MSRLLHKQLRDQTLKDMRGKHPKSAEFTEEDPDSQGVQKPVRHPLSDFISINKISRGPPSSVVLTPPRRIRRRGPTVLSAGADNTPAYPAWRHLTTQEVKRSVVHAPIDPKTKKPICWDAICHVGCRRSYCPNAHKSLPAMSHLDPTVAMQVQKRRAQRGEAGPK